MDEILRRLVEGMTDEDRLKLIQEYELYEASGLLNSDGLLLEIVELGRRLLPDALYNSIQPPRIADILAIHLYRHYARLWIQNVR